MKEVKQKQKWPKTENNKLQKLIIHKIKLTTAVLINKFIIKFLSLIVFLCLCYLLKNQHVSVNINSLIKKKNL